jgi:predicted AlkP superfamily phosphohydrolase/phosphomutase
MRLRLLSASRRTAALAALMLLAVSAAAKPAAPKVILLGIDGASWNVLDPLLQQGRLPNLAALVARGARGTLLSFENNLSEIVWTSVATGKSPEKHGIDRLLAEGDRRLSSEDRRSAALWNMLTARGLSGGVFGWRVAWPAEKVNGVMVPYESLVFRPATRQTHPPALWKSVEKSLWTPTAEERTRFLARFGPFRFDPGYASLPKDSAAFREARMLDRQLVWVYPLDENVTRLAVSQASARRFDCLAVYWRGVDTVSHGFWRYREPERYGASADETARFGRVIDAYYEFMDETVGRVLALAGPETQVWVVSDHGFQAGPPEDVFSGAHRREGVWIAAGPGIVPGENLAEATVLDVTPTLLWLLGLPVAEDMDGHPLTSLYDEAFRRARPVARVATYDAPSGKTAPPAERIPVPPSQMEWLRDLGYLR